MGITMIVTGRLGKPERPSFFIPKGALTHHPCRSLMDNATSRWCCCHCPRSYRKHTRFCVCEQGYNLHPHLAPTACENLPRAALSQLWVSLLRHPFSFCEKETKTGTPCFGAYPRKDGENEWRSTTWKPRWSAEVRDGLRLPLPLI